MYLELIRGIQRPPVAFPPLVVEQRPLQVEPVRHFMPHDRADGSEIHRSRPPELEEGRLHIVLAYASVGLFSGSTGFFYEE